MNRYMEDDLPTGEFYSFVQDKILVDEFKPKFGDEKDFAVFSFLVKQRDTAHKLMNYIVQKNFNLLDVGVSPNLKPDPKNDWKYILFIEMSRNKDMFATMDKLLIHIDHLVSIKQWYFKASGYKEYMDWDRDNFVKVVPQTADEYSNKEPVPGGPDEPDEPDEIGNVTENSKDADINHRLLEEIIERQEAKLHQAYIKTLKEQIITINENKLQMSRYIEDLKIDREHLYKQLELSHDREKMALLREQQDFKRIESLENQLALLPAPGSREMKIISPDKDAYDTDVKPIIGVVATEAEVKDEEEIYAEIQDEYKKASEEDQRSDEAPALSESSDLDIVFDLDDEIDSGESSDFVKKEHRDYPGVDESVEKSTEQPVEQPDHEASINAEKDKPEREKPKEEKIDKTDNEKANRVKEPFVLTEGEEVSEPETPVETQDRKHIESADSSAAALLDDIIAQNLSEESTAKGDDEFYLAEDPVPKYMALGQKALEKEDYDNAIEHFLKVVDILPTAGTVVLNLADLYFLKKEYEAARKYAAQALDLGEEGATVVLDKINSVLETDAGMLSVEKNREEVAEDEEDREPEQEIIDDLQDTICIELDALNEAIDSTDNTTPDVIEEAVSKDDDEKIDQKKDDARKYTSLGVEAASQKDYHKAIEHFSKAVEILPDNAAGFCNLAVLNYRLKEYETAYRDAQKAIYLGSPSATQILEKIKLVMVADLKSTEGFEPASEIGKIKSSQVAWKDEGEAFFIESDSVTPDEFTKTEKQNQSDSAADASLREKDAVVNDNFRFGLEAVEKKEFRKAIEYFNKVVELLPNGIPSYIHLTKTHYYLGEYPQAIKYAKKAIALGDYTLKPILEKLDAKLAKESASVSSTKPMELKEQETPAETIEGTEEEPEELESHADAKPDKKAMEDELEPEDMVKLPDVESVEPVALAKEADSRENTTPGSIGKAVSKDADEKTDQKEDAKKYMALGVEAAGQQDYHMAVEHFSKVVEILPDSAVGFFNLALFHYHLENYNTACKHAEKALNLGLNSAQSLLEKSKSKISTVSKAPPEKKKEKPQATEAPVETDEAKSDKTTKTQLELQYEEPKETIAPDKTVLNQAQELVEPAGNKQPVSGNELVYRTLPPVTPMQKESTQVPSKSDSVSEYFKLGLAASESNDFTVALEYFNKVATALPKVPYSFLNMADLHYRMKNYKTARKHAEKALELGSHAAHSILSKIEDSL
ncbi:MAG: tetratricopeptide repeat protein [Deltaproteobacteria bacterium]|nr:tetratricopeptide repeat protein [Deltaproteobacteria bacterium]